MKGILLGAMLGNQKDAEIIPETFIHSFISFYKWLLGKASFLLLSYGEDKLRRGRYIAILEA